MDAYTSECVLLEKRRSPDGYGGYTTSWEDGVHFSPAWDYESAPVISLAEQEGKGRIYKAFIDKTLDLDYHDVFRRIDDGQVFRVINPGVDRHTPDTSRLNRRLIEVEKWEIPHSDTEA